MKPAVTAAAILLLAGSAMAAPGDPCTVRGTLEWPASLSADPFVVVRADDGRLYYTRDEVRVGDQVKLFGVPQKDRRLVANGFIQEALTAPSAGAGSR